MARQKITQKLIDLLQSNQHLKQALEISFRETNEPGLQTLNGFYDFLDEILTHIPTERELMPSVRKFYYVIGKSSGDILKKDKAFNEWINEFSITRGDFLDTPESAKCLETFIKNPAYKINEYMRGPSGWLSFNQFLGRQIKPGLRPVEGLCDDSVIVSPCDGVYMGQWPIAYDSTITVKGTKYSIIGLLGESKFKDKFKEGIFSHIFLDVTDYHRYHVPVSGVIREIKKTPAKMWVHEKKKPDSSLEGDDDVGFQFEHTRASVIIESPVGFVGVIPVGMGHISSVNIEIEDGVSLTKGNEFGYFAFGGSDIILLFEKDKVNITAEKDKQYKQGQQIAKAIK